MFTEDSLNAIGLDKRMIVIPVASLGEINRGHADSKLLIHILYSHQKFSKAGLYHEYIAHRVNFLTNC